MSYWPCKFFRRNGQSGVLRTDSYMALLFVPIGVGVMQYFDLLRAQFGPVVVSCAVSTLVVFLVVSWSSQLVHGERKVVGQKGSEE
ncbi:putative effector of murein hydrolase LrgA [Escherichia coli]|uniref:Putative effector of murein hydrolase LrgA n=1 Tax=Escherichia coli TaxID=562 RepID=A0A376S8X7_ECOLX|nr:putative effector of murein hydrolase LrgA [Escherichia coli]